MTTHTELLNQLIAAVYALPLGANSKEIHDLQMLAAEIKGRMQSDTQPSEPTPDADGWVVNTGDRPSRVYLDAIMHKDGKITHLSGQDRLPILWIWDTENTTIAKYKPA